MTDYNVDFSREALTSLSQLDKQIAQRVLGRIKWLSIHIEDVNHKALTGNLRGAFKLRWAITVLFMSLKIKLAS